MDPRMVNRRSQRKTEKSSNQESLMYTSEPKQSGMSTTLNNTNVSMSKEEIAALLIGQISTITMYHRCIEKSPKNVNAEGHYSFLEIIGGMGIYVTILEHYFLMATQYFEETRWEQQNRGFAHNA